MNILLVMADQLSFAVLPPYGDTAAVAPNIDLLARSGTVFENAYCPSPLCVPSRASMLTGRLTTSIASYDNGSELPASVPTFVHHLRSAGWRTVLSGKMHFIGPDQLHGFEERLTPDIYPSDFGWTPDWSAGPRLNNGSNIGEFTLAGPVTSNEQIVYDDNVHARALRRIRSFSGDAPFFLCVSYSHPHRPFQTSPEYWDRYAGVDIPLPAAPPRPFEEMNLYEQWIQVHHGVDKGHPDEASVLRARRAYYGMVSYVDDRLGELMRALHDSGLADDTLVIFTSDHGEMLGEHGMWFKRTYHECSSRVPLIVSRPGTPPRRAAEVVSHVDLFPTVLDLAGVDPPASGIDGDSFAAALDGPVPTWKNTAVLDYCGEGPVRPMRMLRSGPFKYVHVDGMPPLLYNIAEDPLELHNLAADPACADTALSLKAKLFDGYDPAALHAAVLASQRERIFMYRSLRQGSVHSWNYIPPQ
ncbi:MAG: choline-sulfatase [Planctomycetes bacterium]|nr:choline-sulfatase [Planctomycetota bacterium]